MSTELVISTPGRMSATACVVIASQVDQARTTAL
jgi:hypothetical protein